MTANALDALRRDKLGDMLVVIAIAAVSLTVAYVTFGVLRSNAEGEFKAYSVGGALAGFLITASFLWSIYQSLGRSSRELEDLRSQNRALEQKLIRGAPHPVGFTIEVDESERIVLARPQQWKRRGGTLFDFIQSYDDGRPDGALPADDFPAHLEVSFAPVPGGRELSPDAFYERVIAWANEGADAGCNTPPTFEYVFVGEPPDGIRSLKVAYSQYVDSRWHRDKITHQVLHEYELMTEAQFRSHQAVAQRTVEAVGAEARVGARADGTRRANAPDPVERMASPDDAAGTDERRATVKTYNIDVVCFHPALERVFYFRFIDDMSDFSRASTDFSHLLNSTRFLL